jgi:hypothetical protein
LQDPCATPRWDSEKISRDASDVAVGGSDFFVMLGGPMMSATNDDRGESSFRIRASALARAPRGNLPEEIILLGDGAAVVAYAQHERLLRYESISECLEAHGLLPVDLDPVAD